MSWLLWRQHRNQVIASSVAVALFAVVVAITGIRMADIYRDAQACTVGSGCVNGSLFNGYGAIIDTVHLTLLVPLMLGAFVAAPLVAREAERRTNALVWTQGVTRRRWMVSKAAAVLSGSVVLSAVVSTLVTWWSGTTNALNGDRFQGAQFDTQNLTPVAFTVFAVGLGLFAGACLRGTMPAVVTTVVGYVVVRMAVGVFVRPHWFAPVTKSVGVGPDGGVPKGSWLIAQDLITPSGSAANGSIRLPRACGRTEQSVNACLDRLGYHMRSTFHPPSQYWSFQLVESALFAGVGLTLVGAAIAWTLRRDA